MERQKGHLRRIPAVLYKLPLLFIFYAFHHIFYAFHHLQAAFEINTCPLVRDNQNNQIKSNEGGKRPYHTNYSDSQEKGQLQTTRIRSYHKVYTHDEKIILMMKNYGNSTVYR